MRKFSPRELNWLKKYGVSVEEAEKFGEMPVEYITGFAEFCGREFAVTPDVLIPRIETEELIVHSIKLATSLHKSDLMIVDVGTGCGCIGITLYLELVKLGIRSTVYLSDISEKVLKIAEGNIFRLIRVQKVQPWRPPSLSTRLLRELSVHGSWGAIRRAGTPRLDLITLNSDLFSNYPKGLKFDLIVANLPYVPAGRWQRLPESVRKFEPRNAIDGGEDGTAVIKKLRTQLDKRLYKEGAVILEIDETHSEKTFDFSIGGKSKEKHRLEIKPDQFGKNRFLILYKK